MARNRKSAKSAGTRFERQVADYLAQHVDDRIDRRVKTGAKDRGDIAGLRHMGGRVTVECKNTARISLAAWAQEVEIERGNDDALCGVIMHKRQGKGRPADQWVTMTLGDFVALITGNRGHLDKEKER
ncbi:hypothetical protein [Flaviflexus massiliensis]|uniref:hypothetical protein n=1 Tax=Flaviflexus massiliensis TaxID=1522309 RepID=UPI0006D5A94F|nr:hypothetical protein [Flaviflexus massiliensis]